MKSFDKDLKKYSEKIKLKVSERRELRERVLSYMEYHPLPKQGSVVDSIPEGGILSEAYTKLRISPFHLRIAGGFFVLLLIVIPIFAERSVPGDVLYILKTEVNEKIQAQLANSPYEKIEFETKLMERRIAEAVVLASEGKLTEETKEQLEKTVREHAQAVRDELTELSMQDAEGAALAEIAFSSSLEVQSTVLGATEDSEGEILLGDILTVINNARDETILKQEENKPSYIGLVAQIELQTTRAYELFETIKETVTEEEIADIDRRLSDINRLFSEAKDGFVYDESKAVADSSHVLGFIQKLISFMTNIDVREAVTLESLVPVVLSAEERTSLANEEILSIERLKAEILQRIETIEENSVVEQVTGELAIIDEFMTKIQVALEIKDIDIVEEILTEARALIDDLDAMTTPVEAKEVTVEEEIIEPPEDTEELSYEEVQDPIDIEMPVEETATQSTSSPEVVVFEA